MKNIPKLRFKGFSGEWEERELQAIVEVIDGDRGNNYPNETELQKIGHTLFLSASNVTNNNFKFDNNQYITEEKSNSMGNGKLVADDIVLTSRGSIGHIAWYNDFFHGKIPFARINSGMLILRTKEFVMPCIVAQFLKSPLGKKKLELISFGSAQPQLTKKSVSNYKVTLPFDGVEQTKIGDYFQHLDKLIEQKEKKYQKLRQFKKAMLDKMFPKNGANTPEIRFKGFSGEWEEKKLQEVAEVIDGDRGNNYPSETELQKLGHTLFLSASNVTNNSFKFDNNQYITEEKSNSMGNGKLVADDIVLTSRGSIGHIAWYNDSVHEKIPFARINSGMLILRTMESIMPCIVAQFLKSPLGQNTLELISFGSAQPQLTKKSVSNYKITLPLDGMEQTKIGNYFQKLDKLIDLQLQELTKLKNIKKASLDKMFV